MKPKLCILKIALKSIDKKKWGLPASDDPIWYSLPGHDSRLETQTQSMLPVRCALRSSWPYCSVRAHEVGAADCGRGWLSGPSKRARRIVDDGTPLTDEILVGIFAGLPDLVLCAGTCRRWRRLVSGEAAFISRVSRRTRGVFVRILALGLFYTHPTAMAFSGSRPSTHSSMTWMTGSWTPRAPLPPECQPNPLLRRRSHACNRSRTGEAVMYLFVLATVSCIRTPTYSLLIQLNKERKLGQGAERSSCP
jgi:hypothetical protein